MPRLSLRRKMEGFWPSSVVMHDPYASYCTVSPLGYLYEGAEPGPVRS